MRAVPPLSMGRFTGVGSPAPSRLGESRSHWLRAAILVGAVYLAVGLTFSALASAAESHRMVVLWRLAAWVISAAAFGAHIWHEHARQHNSPRTTAWHAAAAVALGAFGLAVAARIHAHVTATGNPRLITFALVAWPVVCGLPAFVVALIAATGLALRRRTE